MKTKLVIFGITGDLSHRKLLPALDEIIRGGEYDDLSIVGVSRREVDIATLLENQPGLIPRTTIFTMDLAEPSNYRLLADFLDLRPDEQALIYLAVPPGAAADIVDFLGQATLNSPNVKLLFEKPFGFDLASAKDFIERTSRYYREDQLYRIDHYMAKEVAREIINLRSNAANHHHNWSNQSITAIDVVAAETLDVKDRAGFYEQTGALRDFIQGHLMQLVSLVLMDTGEDFDTSKLPERRLRALSQIVTADPSKAARRQYDGYQDDVVNVGSVTETFASVELESKDPKWQDVSIRLITGKRLDDKRTYIDVFYNDGSRDTFEEGKVAVEGRLQDAYERVLVEAISGRKSIFTTSPEMLRSWEILAELQENWAMDDRPLKVYRAGSSVDEIMG